MAELDQRVDAVKQRFWRGRDFPFPLLLDANGQTLTRYDVHAFPTAYLVDPEGRLVGPAELKDLKRVLAEN